MNLSDDALAAGVHAGDEEMLRALDQRFRGRLEKLALHRGVPGADCADVAQEVLHDAIRQLQRGQFRGAAALSTWLHRILIGKIADYWRRHARHSSEVSIRGSEELRRLSDQDSDQDIVVGVREALMRLSAEDRLILILYEQQRYTLIEVGRLLGIRKSAAAERVQRARMRFKEVLTHGRKTTTNHTTKELADARRPR